MKLTIELFIDEPASDDIDELTELVSTAVEHAVGEADFIVSDVGLNFELNDA